MCGDSVCSEMVLTGFANDHFILRLMVVSREAKEEVPCDKHT